MCRYPQCLLVHDLMLVSNTSSMHVGPEQAQRGILCLMQRCQGRHPSLDALQCFRKICRMLQVRSSMAFVCCS